MEDVETVEQQGIAQRLREYVEEQTAADSFSGAVMLTKDGVSVLTFAAGSTNKSEDIPNTPETQFNLGSINKLFTAVAIAQLVEKGLILFDDKVGKLIPDYPNIDVREQVTIGQLLTHTSGLGSFIDLEHREQFLAEREKLKTISDVVNLFKDRPLPFSPGEYHYSSDGYELLGLIVEASSGRDYYDYIREHIYEVADMRDTDSYAIDPKNPKSNIAIGYTNKDSETGEIQEGGRTDNLRINFLKGTAGGAGYSTCWDMVKFSKALLGNNLLSPEMTKEMLKPRMGLGSKDGQHKYQGYGFQIFEINGIRRIGHAGRFVGVNARLDMYPELGITVVVLSNYDPPAAFNVAEKATELLTSK